VRDVALGLVSLGIERGDRVAVLANTRVEFAVADLAISTAGAIVVPVYPSNSADECQWVVGNSQSRAIVCEDATQVSKIDSVRTNLPDLEHVVVIDGAAPGTMTLDELGAHGAGGDAGELDRRIAAVSDDDGCLIIYTSGTTGRPKGVLLTNRGFAAGRASTRDMRLFGCGDTVYLYLPLAHVFGQICQAATLEVGGALAFWGGDPNQIIAELGQLQPTVLPSVPRIFEKVYALAMAFIPPDRADAAAAAITLGVRVRDAAFTGLVPHQRIGRRRVRRAEFTARDIDQIGHDGAGRRPVARTRALEQQPADEIALRHHCIGGAGDMRQRVAERYEVRVDALEQAVRPRIRNAEQAHAVA
jgi:long-chain acyl-CoA synthetase